MCSAVESVQLILRYFTDVFIRHADDFRRHDTLLLAVIFITLDAISIFAIADTLLFRFSFFR